VHEIAVLLGPTAMLHHVGLEVAGWWVLPIGKGADRHTAPNRRAYPRAALAPARGLLACRRQEAVDRGRTDAEQLLLDCRVECQVARLLQCADEQRESCLQPLAADPVAGLPEHDERLAYRFIIETMARARPWPRLRRQLAG
jgi:hypothetical protein